MAKKRFFIGIDVGGTKVLTALMDRKYKISKIRKLKIEPSKGSKYFLDLINESVEDVLDQGRVKASEIAAIGVGCPGIIDKKHGVILNSPNLPFLVQYPLKDKIKKRFK